jgi:beta-lactamase regulating signal transducer with metallopeptidase domain
MIAWAFEFVLSATVLMLLVLAVRKPVAQLFGAEWAYAMWLLPLVLPFMPDLPSLSPAPAFTVLLPQVHGAAAPAAAAGAAAVSSGEWLLLILAFWGGGAAFFAIWQQSTYSAFMLHLGPQGRTAIPPSYGGIKVVQSDAVEGPVALGIFKRRIVVPLDFATRYSAAEQRLALEHELVHHRRLDLVWNWIALGILTLLWFNPIAHLSFRAFRADQELACDAAVTRRAPGQRHDYACALVKSASQPGLIAVCPLNHAEFLKRRLKMMKEHRASWTRTFGGAVSIAMVAALGMALATPGFAQEEQAAAAQVVLNEPGGEPLISKADIARLREKCGGSGRSKDMINCSDEEARDPEVRAIMDRTMKRVEAHVEKAVDEAKIEERVARATAALAEVNVEKDLAHARAAELRARDLARIDNPRHREHVREAVQHAQVRLAHVDMGAHEAQIEHAIHIAHKQLASIDIDAITRDALRAAHDAVRASRSGLSADERRELQEELAEARREALQEAAEARAEAHREAAETRRESAEARREALREALEARRELAREMRQLQRELRHLPPVPVPAPHPPTPPLPPVPAR